MPSPQKLHVIQQLGHTYRAMMSAFDAQVGHALPRWRILFALAERGRCSQKFLAEHCRLDPASLTRQLQAMESLGWISRATDPDDNRLTNVSLTDDGNAVVEEAMPKRAAFFSHALEGLDAAQIEALASALGHLEARFKVLSTLAKDKGPLVVDDEASAASPAKAKTRDS